MSQVISKHDKENSRYLYDVFLVEMPHILCVQLHLGNTPQTTERFRFAMSEFKFQAFPTEPLGLWQGTFTINSRMPL